MDRPTMRFVTATKRCVWCGRRITASTSRTRHDDEHKEKRRSGMRTVRRALLAAAAATALITAGCGTSDDSSSSEEAGSQAFEPPDLEPMSEMGEPVGE